MPNTKEREKRDAALIIKIVARARGNYRQQTERPTSEFDGLAASMDLTAANEAHPLRLAALLAADDFNFNHDVFGIFHHIDRETGTFKDFFTPRYSV